MDELKNTITEEELKRIAGGIKGNAIHFRCVKCGWTMNALDLSRPLDVQLIESKGHVDAIHKGCGGHIESWWE